MAADKFDWDSYSDVPTKDAPTKDAKFDWDSFQDVPTKTESALRGGAQGATLGFADEITGAAQGMWDDAKALFTGKNANNGVKPEFDEFGNVTNGQELTGNYKKYRDDYRAADKAAMEANPITYKASEIGAGVVSGALLPGAATLKGSALMGAAAGLGSSDAEDLGGQTLDAATGAGAGVIGYGIGKGIEKGVKAGKVLLNDEARSAVKTASKDAMNADTLLNAANGKWFSGAIAANKKINEIAANTAEGKALVQTMRKHLGPGSVKDLSDPEVLAIALTDEGQNPVKDFITKKASTLGVDANEYMSLLAKNADESYAARTFSKKAAADEMAPLLDDLRSTFENARTARLRTLTDQARSEFNGDVTPALDAIKKAHAAAGELKSTSGAQAALEDAWDILANGRGGEELGVNAGSWTEHGGPELFNRLQKAREHLDDNIDWTAIKKGTRSPTPIEKKLMKVRDQIDLSLKGASQSKVEADALYRQSKDLEKTFFKLAEDKDGVHEVSLQKLMGDNDKATKFKKWLGDFEDFTNRPDLSEDLRDSSKAFLGKVKAGMESADEQRKLGSFKMRTGGPTSGAVDRIGTVANGSDYVQQFVTSPQQALINREQVSRRAQELFNRSWDQLSSTEKRQLIQYQLWAGKNLEANPEDAAAVWRKILKGNQ